MRARSQTDLDSVLALILRESAGLVNCARCSLFVLDESGTTLTARVFDERQDEVCSREGRDMGWQGARSRARPSGHGLGMSGQGPAAGHEPGLGPGLGWAGARGRQGLVRIDGLGLQQFAVSRRPSPRPDPSPHPQPAAKTLIHHRRRSVDADERQVWWCHQAACLRRHCRSGRNLWQSDPSGQRVRGTALRDDDARPMAAGPLLVPLHGAAQNAGRSRPCPRFCFVISIPTSTSRLTSARERSRSLCCACRCAEVPRSWASSSGSTSSTRM